MSGQSIPRQAPRAPLPTTSVTCLSTASSTMSVAVTPPSSLLRTHASNQNPPSPLVIPLAKGLCRLLSAPAGRWPFPTLSLRIFPHVLGPLPRLLSWCSYPFLPIRQRPSRRIDPVGAVAFTAIAYSHTATSVWGDFSRLQSFTNVQARGFARHTDCSYLNWSLRSHPSQHRRVRWASHRFRFGPQSDSHSALIDSSNPLGSRGFYFPAYLSSLPLRRAGDILTARFG